MISATVHTNSEWIGIEHPNKETGELHIVQSMNTIYCEYRANGTSTSVVFSGLQLQWRRSVVMGTRTFSATDVGASCRRSRSCRQSGTASAFAAPAARCRIRRRAGSSPRGHTVRSGDPVADRPPTLDVTPESPLCAFARVFKCTIRVLYCIYANTVIIMFYSSHRHQIQMLRENWQRHLGNLKLSDREWIELNCVRHEGGRGRSSRRETTRRPFSSSISSSSQKKMEIKRLWS